MKRSGARTTRLALVAVLITAITLAGGMVTAVAAALAQAAGATPEVQRLLVIGSAALIAFAGVWIIARTAEA